MIEMSFYMQLELIARLLIAGVCGGLIGYERKNRNKEAGIRTHIIVAIASCLMMEISKYGFSDIGDFDGARLAAQVVSGIGFLGAGMIFVHKNSVKGLTTAAGVWATSGMGMYVIGIVTTIVIFLFQILLHKNFKFLRHQNSENIVFVLKKSENALQEACDILKKEEITYTLVSLRNLKEEKLQLEFAVSFFEDYDMTKFIQKISEIENIEEVYSA